PGCVQQPRVPFAIAATGPRAIQLAARYAEQWVTTGGHGASGPVDAAAGARIVAGQITMLEDACQLIGRDPVELDRLVLLGEGLDAGLMSETAFADVVGA